MSLRLRAVFVWILVCGLIWPSPTRAYAVLAHEAIIDAVWETHIKPLLLSRFPGSTEEQLSEAQAYAYGGSIIQDMGYYFLTWQPFFQRPHALRAKRRLCGTAGDEDEGGAGEGHKRLLRDAQGRGRIRIRGWRHGALRGRQRRPPPRHKSRCASPLSPNCKKVHGDTVSYEQDPLAHTKTEFGFDVLEVAHESYAPDGYHDLIGFEVSQDLLDRAFVQTYGLQLKDVLVDEDKALNSYRHAVSNTIPMATKVAWSLKKDEIKTDFPDITRKKFRYNLSKSNYEREWGNNYQKPTRFRERFLPLSFTG